MKTLYPLRGIVTVLNTPFTSRGDIDYESFRQHVLYALDAGVSGFLVPAMASEVYKLTLKERVKLVEATLTIAGGRVPVFAGLGEKSLSRSRTLIKYYLDIGCKEFLLQIPFKNINQFKYHFYKLAEYQPDVIMLQDWDASGYGLDDTLIYELFEEVEAFRCLKVEVIPAGVKYSRILKITDGKLNISGGWAVNQMIEGLMRGVHAFMPTGLHYVYTQIYKYYINGNHSDAEKLFSELLPVIAFSNQHLDISIHFFKRLLVKQNIFKSDYVRDPSLPFDDIHETLSGMLIDKALILESKIKLQR